MAGISAMGDLSHELETLVIAIDGGMVSGDDHAHTVMQTSLDELARMRDLVSTGVLPASAQALLKQIRDLSGGADAAAETSATPEAAPLAPSQPATRSATAPPAEPSATPRPGTPIPLTAAPIAARAAPTVAASANAALRGARAIRSCGAGRCGIRPRGDHGGIGGVDFRGFALAARGEHRPGASGTREHADGAGRDGPRRRGPARLDAEQCRRSEHLPLTPRSTGQFHRLQSGRARAHGDPAQGPAACPRDGDRGAGAQPASRRGGSSPRRLRPPRARSLFLDTAVLARARRDLGRRRQHPGNAGDAHAGGAKPLDPAGPDHHGAAKQPDAHPHGSFPAARAAAYPAGASGGERHRQAGRARRAGGRRRARSPDARAHGAAARAHAAQLRRPWHRAARAPRGARQTGRGAHRGHASLATAPKS